LSPEFFSSLAARLRAAAMGPREAGPRAAHHKARSAFRH